MWNLNRVTLQHLDEATSNPTRWSWESPWPWLSWAGSCSRLSLDHGTTVCHWWGGGFTAARTNSKLSTSENLRSLFIARHQIKKLNHPWRLSTTWSLWTFHPRDGQKLNYPDVSSYANGMMKNQNAQMEAISGGITPLYVHMPCRMGSVDITWHSSNSNNNKLRMLIHSIVGEPFWYAHPTTVFEARQPTMAFRANLPSLKYDFAKWSVDGACHYLELSMVRQETVCWAWSGVVPILYSHTWDPTSKISFPPVFRLQAWFFDVGISLNFCNLSSAWIYQLGGLKPRMLIGQVPKYVIRLSWEWEFLCRSHLWLI